MCAYLPILSLCGKTLLKGNRWRGLQERWTPFLLIEAANEPVPALKHTPGAGTHNPWGPTSQSQLRRGLSIWAQNPWHKAHISFYPFTHVEQPDPTLALNSNTPPHRPNVDCSISVSVPVPLHFPRLLLGRVIWHQFILWTDQIVTLGLLIANCHL